MTSISKVDIVSGRAQQGLIRGLDRIVLQCTDFWKITAGRIFKFALALRCTVFSYVVRTYRDPLLRYEFEEQRSAIKALMPLARTRKLM